MILWGIFVGVVVVMAWGGGSTMGGLFLVAIFAGLTSLLLRYVYHRDHVPAFAAVLVLIAAYFPSAWQALDKGFVYPIFASDDAVALALFALIIFMGVALGVQRLSVKWFVRPAEGLEYVATAGRPGVGTVALGLLLLICTVAGFRTGLWSHYGSSTAVKTQSGGVRMELLYLPLLFGFSVATGRAALKELISPRMNTKHAFTATIFWILTIAFLFIAQSRRAMLGALILTLASAWLDSPRISVVRTGFVATGLTGVGAILLVGSYLWRSARPTGNAVEQLQIISNSSVDIEELSQFSQSLADRLTYLWIDSASIEHYQALQNKFDLLDVANSVLIRATPELLMPDKYDTKKIVCEHAYEMLGLRTDLPCTPTAEGIIFGGVPGLFITAAFFGLALGIVTAIYRRGTFASLTLGCAAMYNCVLIECSAFPIIDSLRTLIITGAASGSLAWLLRTGDLVRWILRKKK